MYQFEDIYTKSSAYKYQNWDIIKDQLNQVKKYNFNNQTLGFLHPKVDDLVENELPINNAKLDLLNHVEHKKERFKPCAQPWASVHINVDGTVFPCLAVPMGNIQETSINEIVFGTEYRKFRSVIKTEGTVEACNRCGWLQPAQN